MAQENAPNPATEVSAWFYDTETYPNYFLAVFKSLQEDQQGQTRIFEASDLDNLKDFLSSQNLVLIGYNNFRFDDVILKAILDGQVRTAADIAKLANRIIDSPMDKDKGLRRLTYHSRSEWHGRSSPWICIDLLQILGGAHRAGTLKSHEVRLALPNVQDLPFKPGDEISAEDETTLIEYCKNDVNATEALYYDLESDVDVRQAVNEAYPHLNTSAFRRSNASIAEEVVKRKLGTTAGLRPRDIRKPAKFVFEPSKWIDLDISFQTSHNQEILDQLRNLSAFSVDDWGKKISAPFLFHIGPHKIALGEGGAHTSIPHLIVESDAIAGYDVASYYPNLIRRLKRYPSGLTADWMNIVNDLTDQRLAAKSGGDTAKADVYKIIINSIYGKLKDRSSLSRDDSLQLGVVLNGQLFLIMLMEVLICTEI